jgi:hypothetical protein
MRGAYHLIAAEGPAAVAAHAWVTMSHHGTVPCSGMQGGHTSLGSVQVASPTAIHHCTAACQLGPQTEKAADSVSSFRQAVPIG